MDTSMSNIGNPYKLGNVPGFCPTCMEPIRHHAKDCPERHAEVRQPDVEDIVVKPSHYARWAIEPITFIMRNGFEFWRGNDIRLHDRLRFRRPREGEDYASDPNVVVGENGWLIERLAP